MHQELTSQMTHILRSLILNPDALHYRRIKIALWLYLNLVFRVNPETGKHLFDPQEAANETGIREETLRSWLGHLRRGGYVACQKQGREIVVKISGVKTPRELTGERKDLDRIRSTTSKEIPNHVGRQNALAHEIAETFCDTKNLAAYQVLCENYPLEIIHRAFGVVKNVPQKKIKKSRGALFTYLVKQYAQEKTNSNSRH